MSIGIRAFKEEYQARSYIVVSMDTNPRRTEDGIEILPWQVFLNRLWADEIIKTWPNPNELNFKQWSSPARAVADSEENPDIRVDHISEAI